MSTTELTLRKLRGRILDLAYRSGEGHVPSSLSVLEIIWTLYDRTMKPGDVFILSKGHAALALYVVLEEKGILPTELLDTFGQEGSIVYGHPDIAIPGVYCSTGSLGHGCCVSIGAAYAKRLKAEPGRVHCLIGDGECDEGSVTEAAKIGARLKLDNLVWYIDDNGTAQSPFDLLSWMGTRWPTLNVVKTVKGSGIPEMEADPQGWHRRKMQASEYEWFRAVL